MLRCNKCAYQKSIPGDCHIQCQYDWANAPKEVLEKCPVNADIPDRARQWFRFPLNYDPVWGPNECPAQSEVLDQSKVAMFDPFLQLLALLR